MSKNPALLVLSTFLLAARSRGTAPKPLVAELKPDILRFDPFNLIAYSIGLDKSSPAKPYPGRYPCGSLIHDGVWYYTHTSSTSPRNSSALTG